MNSELKNSLQVVFDIVKVVEGAVAKQDFVVSILPGLYKLATDIPAVVSNWNDLMPEIKALSGAEADADLIAFVISQVAGVSSDSHAQKIVAAALDLALSVGQKAVALEQAIKG